MTVFDYGGEQKPDEQTFDKNGKLHSFNDEPARVVYHNKGAKNVHLKVWYSHGVKHRENGPTLISYYVDGSVKQVDYYSHGSCHRISAPASLYYADNNVLMHVEYYEENKLHRVDGPARLTFDRNTEPVTIEYYQKGEGKRKDSRYPVFCHFNTNTRGLCRVEWEIKKTKKKTKNINKNREMIIDYAGLKRPSIIEYGYNGSLKKHIFKNNTRSIHSFVGPAITHWDEETGEVVKEQYWVNNKNYGGDYEAWRESSVVQEYYREVKNNTHATIVSDVSF